MALTNFEEDQFDQDDLGGEIPPEPERRPSNRNFVIAIAVVGAIFLLSLILLLLLGPGLLANQQAAQQEQAAQINAANTATAMAATAAVQAQQATLLAKTTVAPTAAPVLPTKTPVVVVQASTPGTGTGLSAAELATVSALQTQMAGSGGVGTPAPTSTALPTSGFADEVGLPMMAGLAIVLVAVILLSRKLRLSSH